MADEVNLQVPHKSVCGRGLSQLKYDTQGASPLQLSISPLISSQDETQNGIQTRHSHNAFSCDPWHHDRDFSDGSLGRSSARIRDSHSQNLRLGGAEDRELEVYSLVGRDSTHSDDSPLQAEFQDDQEGYDYQENQDAHISKSGDIGQFYQVWNLYLSCKYCVHVEFSFVSLLYVQIGPIHLAAFIRTKSTYQGEHGVYQGGDEPL